MAQAVKSEGIPNDLSSILRVNNNGYNMLLFENESEVRGAICDDPTELDCDWDHQY